MPIFEYKAKNIRGELLEGVYETATQQALEYMLHQKGFFLVEAERKARNITLFGLFGRVTVKDLSIFCRQFSVMLNVGISIVEAIGILRDQAEKKKLRDILDTVHEELQKGRVLSDAMAFFPDTFPEFMLSMIRVGEASGSLEAVLVRLSDFYENDNKIRQKVRTAMTYPTVLAVLTVAVVILLMTTVLPMFANILSSIGGQLPLITRILMGVSRFLATNIIAVIIVSILLIASLSYWFKSTGGRYWVDSMKLRLPLIKRTIVKVMTSRFARSMGILLKSGIPLIKAIDIISDLIGNRVLEERFKECREEIKEGRGIAGPIRRLELFPPLLVHMVAVGESTGELDDMLSRTAEFFDEEVEEAIQKLTTLIEPAMIVLMALVVGTIILSIMLPMVSIMSTVQ